MSSEDDILKNPFIITIIILQTAFLIAMIIFAVIVLKKCRGDPKWLNPTVITLLILWVLIGWFPGIGFLLFITLLTILIIFALKCKNPHS